MAMRYTTESLITGLLDIKLVLTKPINQITTSNWKIALHTIVPTHNAGDVPSINNESKAVLISGILVQIDKRVAHATLCDSQNVQAIFCACGSNHSSITQLII